eukprot:jgi/Picre1/29721/NNA_005104.t1
MRTALRGLCWRELNSTLVEQSNSTRERIASSYFSTTSSNHGTDSKDMIDACLRVDHVSVQAVASFFKGMAMTRRHAPDIQSALEVEQQLKENVSDLMHASSSRPSLLQPVTQACFGAAGLLVGATARATERDSVVAGIYDALVDVYTDQLREIRESGSKDDTKIRVLLRKLRDVHESSLPDGTLPIPDVVSLSSSDSHIQPSQYASLLAKEATLRVLHLSKTL